MIFPDGREWYERKYDKFGFYTVGDFKTYSKLDAIEVAQRMNLRVKWNFNDAVFSSYDWTIEPKETLKELYTERAKQLRKKYDHIVLLFSGGADSTVALQSFVQNGIKLDEILIYVSEDGDKDKNSIFNIEAFQAAFPLIQKLKPLMPDTVITKFDVTSLMFSSVKEHKIDMLYEMNSIFSHNVTSRSSIRDHELKWKRMTNAGKKVTFLWGHQKPMIHNTNNKEFYYYIDDRMDFCVTPRQQILNADDENDELFYSSPDCVPLVIKQAHVVKKFLQSPTHIDGIFVKGQPGLGHYYCDGVKHGLTLPGLNTIIYPSDWWNPNTFSKGKPDSMIFIPADVWFRRENIEQSAYVNKQLDAVYSKFGLQWIKNMQQTYEGIVPIRSSLYKL